MKVMIVKELTLLVIPNTNAMIESGLFGSTTTKVESIVFGWTTHIDVSFHSDKGKYPWSMYIIDVFFFNFFISSNIFNQYLVHGMGNCLIQGMLGAVSVLQNNFFHHLIQLKLTCNLMQD